MDAELLVIPSTRHLDHADILSFLEKSAEGGEDEREAIIAKFLDAAPGEWAAERKRIRSALTLTFWQNIEHLKQKRIDLSRFILMTFPIFMRFCMGTSEVTDEDRWVIALIEHDRYSWKEDPVAAELEGYILEIRESEMTP